jgi:penicillin-binding protein 2
MYNGQEVAIAGKTGTAEYCDNVAQQKGLCISGNWPTHSWFVGYAPYDDPEIAVVAFVYNGGEGASVSGPIAKKVFDAYFQLKAIDEGVTGTATTTTGQPAQNAEATQNTQTTTP